MTAMRTEMVMVQVGPDATLAEDLGAVGAHQGLAVVLLAEGAD